MSDDITNTETATKKKTPLNKIGENIAVFAIHMQDTHT